jgi:hypothetical protein
MGRCRSCGGVTLPLIRPGLPTIYAYGPFPDHVEVDYSIETHGTIQQETKDSDAT